MDNKPSLKIIGADAIENPLHCLPPLKRPVYKHWIEIEIEYVAQKELESDVEDEDCDEENDLPANDSLNQQVSISIS